MHVSSHKCIESAGNVINQAFSFYIKNKFCLKTSQSTKFSFLGEKERLELEEIILQILKY
jgi:hypothetical protein